MQSSLVILVVAFAAFKGFCSAQTTLLPAGGGPFCPNEEVVFTCSVAGTALSWEVRLPQSMITTTYFSFHTPGDVRPRGPEGVLVFNLTSTDPLTSTLTTTATPALDATEVICSGESLTLLVVGPPSPPTSPTSMVTGQTAGTTSATVTVQWGASTSAASVSYTVSISPDIPSPVTTSDTSLELQNAPYNIQRTVSVVATNCAGSSPAENTAFTIVGCVVPGSPVNGEWQEFSPSETVGPGTSLSLSCNPGYEPSEVMASTCQSDGSWEPDTAQLECTVAVTAPATADCGPPTLASGVVLEAPVSSTTFGSTFSFRCEEGLFPNTTFEAVCGADGQWSPDPAFHICGDGNATDCGVPQPPASGSIAPYSSTLEGAVISFQCDQEFSPSEEVTATCVRDEDTGSGTWTPDPAEHVCGTIGGSKFELTTGGAVAITAVLCSVVFFILGAVSGIMIHYCITAKRAQYSVNSSSTEPQTPAPVYEEVTGTDTHPKAIELSENIAYGPARR